MSLQDFVAVFGIALAVGSAIYSYISGVSKKLEYFADRTDRRLDEVSKFIIRVDQRVVNLERQIYGDIITERLRSGSNFRDDDDDDNTVVL